MVDDFVRAYADEQDGLASVRVAHLIQEMVQESPLHPTGNAPASP